MGVFDSVAQAMQGNVDFNPEAVGVKLISASAFLGQIIFFAIVAFGIGFVFYMFFIRFKVRVEIMKYSSGKLVEIKTDIAREVTDNQQRRKLSLFKSLKSTPIPSLKYRLKKGRKDFYRFIEDDNGNLFPCDIDMTMVTENWTADEKTVRQDWFGLKKYDVGVKEKINEIKAEVKKAISETTDKNEIVALKVHLGDEIRRLSLKKVEYGSKINAKLRPIPQERIAWMLQDFRDQEDKIKKDDEFWDRVKTLTPIISYVIIFLIFFFGFKHLGNIGSSVGSGLGEVARACLGR